MAITTTHTRTRADARPGQADLAQLRQVPMAGTEPGPSASAAETVKAYLKTQVARLGELEPQVRADEFDSVHEMRVTTRRLRATLRSFGKVIPRPATSELAADLKWLGGLLGEARDGEVLPQHLLTSLEQVPVELLIGPVQARVRGHFAPRRASAREQIIEAFGSERYARLLASLDRLAHDPPLGPQAAAPARDV